jgi:hypothetical protein
MRSGLVIGDGAVSTGHGYIWPTVTQQKVPQPMPRALARGAARLEGKLCLEAKGTCSGNPVRVNSTRRF